MPAFERVTESQPSAASVRIDVGRHGLPRARIEWGILSKPSPIAGETVGASLPVHVALQAAERGKSLGIVGRVVVVIDNPALWDIAWGELREAD